MLLEQWKNPVVSRNYQMEQKAVWHPTDKQLLQLAFILLEQQGFSLSVEGTSVITLCGLYKQF